MKKILITFGVVGLLVAASCGTPEPAGDQPTTDSSSINNNAQPDSVTTAKPDSAQNQ
jgi:hypothetical protein